MKVNKTQKKRAVILLSALLSPLFVCAHHFEVDGIFYEITSTTNKTVAVTYKGSDYNEYSKEYSGNVIIPPVVTYENEQYNVTSINRGAFYYCNMDSVVIPEGVTNIKAFAFQFCSLSYIVIPASVTSIGEMAFWECSGELIVNCNIPSAPSYTYGAFYAGDFTKIIIGDNVISIGDYAFDGCNYVTSITIPKNVSSIGDYAFSGCKSLSKIINYSSLSLSKGATNNGYVSYYARTVININEVINYSGFLFLTSDGNNSLVGYIGNALEVILPDSYNGGSYKIEDCAFQDCNNLISITIPESVTSIGEYAFYGCNNLTSITISKSVTSIGEYAFFNCNNLISITIPESVTSIGNCAFENCVALKKITFEDGNDPLFLGYNYDGEYYEGKGLFVDCPLETIYLGRNLDYNASRRYGYSPFYNKKSLCSIMTGEKVNSIKMYAFYKCDEISSLTINSGVLSIESNAFSTLNKVIWLTNTPPTGYANTKGNINYVANDQYTKLSNVMVYPHLNSIFEVDGVRFVPVSPSERTCHAIDCVYENSIETINIGETTSFKGIAMKVVEVLPYTFYNNSYIKNASISHLGNIRNNVFEGCSSLEVVTLCNRIVSLGDKAFYQCASLQECVIPDSVETIGEYCFGDCKLLTEICIPKSTKVINDYAFSGCCQMVNFIVQNRNTPLTLGSNGSSALFADCPLDSVYIDGKIIYNTASNKGYSPFYRNTSLRSVVITDEENQIYDNEFYGCTALKNVSIGDGVTTIGDYAFSGCNSLENLSFGSCIKEIGTEAFSDCNNVTQIVSSAVYPPTCGLQALDDINKWDCQLNVPIGYKEAYTETDQWKEFFFIEDNVVVPYYALTFIVDSIVHQVDSLPCGEFIIIPDEPIKEGYTFSGWSEVPEAMPASDVTISGTFTINKYLVTFKIDDEVISADSLEYGTVIVAPGVPDKEGYTFNGWNEVIETVPANDVTIEGSYSVNSYLLTYTVDGEIVKADSIAYGTVITLLDEPTKEGYTFSGWSEAPETMPANDVTISGTFTINQYTITYIIDGEVFATDTINYGEAITVPEVPVKENYDFAWIDEIPETMPAEDIVINGSYTSTDIVNIERNEEILYIYSTDGQRVNELQKGINIVLQKR